ncbi:hypothetical protein N0V95_009509 [Ascochyta clinopodiicola]|nr:hypothetical protein N0V95_009509 [Ascochyta clinopodiicola]
MVFPQVIALLLLASQQPAAAHSWVEQLSNIGSDGSFIAGYGYPRGFVDKGINSFDQNANVWLIPPLERQPPFVTQADLLCHPSQRVAHQTVDYPRLQAVPGGMIAMRYEENGHATIPNGGKALLGKPEKGGTVFVFGTQQPSQEEVLLDVLRWTRDGSGGDGRGVLLTSQSFDDERCYQLGNGAMTAQLRQERTPNPLPDQAGSEHELLCETDVRIPLEVQLDKPYTMYWVWQWPTAPRKDPNYPNGRDEYYTTCLEVDLAPSIPADQIEHPLIQQDPMPSAVTNFRSRGALTADPLALYSASAFSRPSETQA